MSLQRGRTCSSYGRPMDHPDRRMSHPPLLIAPAYQLFAEPS
jgi:hypothetical protein